MKILKIIGIITGVLSLVAGSVLLGMWLNTPHIRRGRLLNVQTNETIIHGLHETARLVVADVPMSYTMQMDDTWSAFGTSLENNLFGNVTSVTMQAKGTFSVDLSDFSSDDIIWEYNGDIAILIPHPSVEAIDVDFESSEFENVQGWLRFGTVRLTPEQQNQLQADMRNNMELTMLREKSPQARETAETQIKELIRAIFEKSDVKVNNIRVIFT